MSAIPEALWETLECSICLDTCRNPYRLPCEHFFCREPCLQGLLNEEQPTCPNCRLVFSEADVEPFRLLSNVVDLMLKSSEVATQQEGQTAICPICVRLVEAPLWMSEHFSDLVCGDCWSTGETLRKLVLDEAREEEDLEYSGSDDVSVQGNQQAKMLANGQRSTNDTEQGKGYISYIASEADNGGRVIYVERLAEQNSTATNAPPLPRKKPNPYQCSQTPAVYGAAATSHIQAGWHNPAHMPPTPVPPKKTPNSPQRAKSKVESKDAKKSKPKRLFSRLLHHKSQK